MNSLVNKNRVVINFQRCLTQHQCIRPLLKGKDIDYYFTKFSGRYLILAKNGIDIKREYPSIFKYLSQFKEKLEKRWDKGKHWSNLRDCDYYEEFKKQVEKGAIDVELLKIYQQLMTRADTLLKIFQTEKSKRGKFTYRTIPQANAEPAKESITNAETFFKHINNLCI